MKDSHIIIIKNHKYGDIHYSKRTKNTTEKK
jgi:hypothetical protein